MSTRVVPLDVVPLDEEHTSAAAAMVAARYRAFRAQAPFLPESFVDPEAVLPRLSPYVGRVPGVAALREGELVGFILSLLVTNRGERLAYVPDFGHAAQEDQEYGVYRQMYARLADRWLANGCFWHGISIYPHERKAVGAWFSVGFGLAVMDAMRTLTSERTLASDPGEHSAQGEHAATGLAIRRAGVADVDQVAPLEIALDRHLAAAPAYLPLLLTGGRSALESWLAEESHALWLAFRGTEAVAYLRFEPSEGLVLPTSGPATVSITGAYTREDVRGTGIGTALLQKGLAWARSAGYLCCAVDFESANLPGSRFWLRHFAPVTHSLMRRVNPNLAWANERRREPDVERAYRGQTWVG